VRTRILGIIMGAGVAETLLLRGGDDAGAES
jgi:hypothetical protein